MKSYGTEDNSPVSAMRGQFAITAQLQKAIPTLHHIDEMLLWLAHAIVRTFEVQAVQWWAFKTERTGQQAMQLRSMASHDTTIPSYVLSNERVSAMVERLPGTPHGFLQMGVERLCTPYQATLFSRYGLHYCAWQVFQNPAFLLPGQRATTDIPTPLFLILLLYSRQAVSQPIIGSINFILDQAIPLAGTYGLFAPAPGSMTTNVISPPATTLPSASPSTTQWPPPASLGPQTAPLSPEVSRPLISPSQPAPIAQPSQPAALTPRPSAVSSSPGDPHVLLDSKSNKSPLLTPQRTHLDLLQLTPRQYEKPLSIELTGMRASKPVIADKQARRLHESIDGKSSLEEVRARINMDLQDLYRAVRFLLIQQRIQLFEPNGQLVDSEPFLKEK